MAPKRKSAPRTITSSTVETEEDDKYLDVIKLLTQLKGNGGGFQCECCGKRFRNKTTCQSHSRRHVNIVSERYKCSECGKCFAQSSTLQNHERVHNREKPFECKYCEVAFADVSTLTKHERLHTGEKPYVCQVCEKRFTQSGNMHRHIRTLHPVTKYFKAEI